MPLQMSDCRRILEGVFCRPDLPEDLRHRFTRWMLGHENDPVLRRAMLEMWEKTPATSDTPSAEGLRRLLHEVDPLSGSQTRGKGFLHRIYRPVAAAAAVAAVFSAGWFAPSLLGEAGDRDALDKTILVSAPESKGHYILPDGTEVWLNSDSRLSYSGDFNRSARAVTLEGEAYFDVAHDETRPFTVALDSLVVEVTGTAFDAINYPFAQVQVALRRGSVSVSGIGDDMALNMTPDQIVTRLRGLPNISVAQTESENYCGWMACKLTFDNRRLADIITNLERRYAVSIEVGPGINLEKRLSLTIGDETFEETASLLEILLSVDFETKGSNVTMRCA